MRFDDVAALVAQRTSILRQVRKLRSELSDLWQNPSLSLEEREAFARIDIHWSLIERMIVMPDDQFGEVSGGRRT